MRFVKWVVRPVVVSVAIASTSAYAAYNFVEITCPGASQTETFGINNAGTVVGNCYDADGLIFRNFTYDSKKGTFTTVPPPSGADQFSTLGINEPGEIIGFVPMETSVPSFIRSKKGVYSTFTHPGSSDTEARGANNNGLVAGFYIDDAAQVVSGFLYDSKTNSFATPGDLVPNSFFTIAQGVNNKGEVVGNAFLPAGAACTGCPDGEYAFFRNKNGGLTYFQINGDPTAARGITDSGVIAGYIDTPDGRFGFVTTLAASPQFQAITIPAGQLLVYPGTFYTAPEGIANDGTIVGVFLDADFNEHSFIATKH